MGMDWPMAGLQGAAKRGACEPVPALGRARTMPPLDGNEIVHEDSLFFAHPSRYCLFLQVVNSERFCLRILKNYGDLGLTPSQSPRFRE
jgi:hypothetical protein